MTESRPKAVPDRRRPLPRRRPVQVLRGPIKRDRTLAASKTWVIGGEVRVARGVTLTIADRATILVANGPVPKSRIRRAALVFDSGSKLVATRFTVRACGADHRPARSADNGGIWFLGTFAAGAKDGIAVAKTRRGPPSSFQARSISVSYLGRRDPASNAQGGDDIDGISLLGVGPGEWGVSAVRSVRSGDDGFDVTNSHVRIDRLEVRNPVEDGLNVSSSRLEIRRSLVLDVGRSREGDRDLFDLETDDGASRVVLMKGCRVRVRGVFGDQLRLTSVDMPRPRTDADNERWYEFSGRLTDDAVILSRTAD